MYKLLIHSFDDYNDFHVITVIIKLKHFTKLNQTLLILFM